MKRLLFLLLLLCFTSFGLAQGPDQGGGPQGPPPGGQGPGGGPGGGGGMMMRHPGMGGGPEMGHMEGHDPVGESLFPPDFILEHGQDINLTTEQKTAIRNEVKNTQSKFTDLQFQLQDETQNFATMLKQPKVDEKQALAELDKVLDLERQIKRLHVGMALRVKNTLNADQLEKLKQLHSQAMHMRMFREGGMRERRGPGGPGGPGGDHPQPPQEDE